MNGANKTGLESRSILSQEKFKKYSPNGIEIIELKISDEEKYVADSLGIPILYRDYKKIELDYQNDEKIEKHYTYTMDKRMF